MTAGVRVRVGAQYIPEQSDPDRQHFMYAYRVIIRNEGERPVRLLSRHWIILDANNSRDEVRGPGVVGEQPQLAPGEEFEYISGCPIPTPWGTMEGSYTMQDETGEQFDAAIGRFFLAPTAAPISALAET
jgi:ApaG protein